MPSHSSSRGNFSSGGSRGGGSSFGGGGFHSGGGHYGPRPPRRPMHFMFFGRTVVLSSGKQSGFVFGIFFFVIMLFFTMIMGFVTNDTQRELSQETKPVYESLKTESKNLIEIVQKAEDEEAGYGIAKAYFNDITYGYYNPKYVTNIDNKVTGAYEYITDIASTPVYYIIYEFEVSGKKYKGETFAQYTSSAISSFDFESGKRTFDVAYHYDGEKMLSINRSYKEADNFEIKEAEYFIEEAEGEIKTTRTICIVTGIIAGGILVIMIFSFVRTVQKSKEEAIEAKEEKERARQDAEDAKKKKYCVHCGSLVSEDVSKCPSCGSSKFERK